MRISLEPEYFSISDTFDLTELFERTHVPFSLKAQPLKKELLLCYDTFDWKAWNKKTAIFLCRRRLSLVDLRNGNAISLTPFRKTPQNFFPEDINDGKAGPTLKTLSKLRAFIRLGSVETEVAVWRALDENRKTVATIEFRSILPPATQQPQAFIKLTPVRGYRKEFEQLAGCLKKSPAYAGKTSYQEIYSAILAVAGLVPGSYISKPSVKLNPESTIQDSARELLFSTLEIIHANETWIPKNIDTEFLHDYRVAIRRTRSILARLKGIFPPDELSRYKQAFRELGKRTNNLRDQDVYLLEAERFRNLLPIAMRESLDPFFTDLRNRHKKELKVFSSYLGSSSHKQLLQEWRSFLENNISSDPETVPNALTVTSDVAVSSIRKAWKKVIRHGRAMSREATDTELHALRLDCKKLRYLLEFYASLFPAKALQPVTRQLKMLQDNLGVFVDLSVQQHYLYSYLSNLRCTAENVPLASALGGLVTALYHERETVRMEFHNRFDKFDKPEAEALFNELLNHYG